VSKVYRFGLLGHNIGYSKSREIFRAAFEISELSGTFDFFDLSPRRFDEGFEEIVRKRFDGLSVTIPFKRRVLEHLDDVHPVASALEAVNSTGFNTDCYGFSLPLRSYSDRLKHGHALILGCGGGARAAAYALYTDHEVRRFTIMGRTKVRLKRCRQSLSAHLNNAVIETLHIDESHFEHPETYDIVVNCTPLGGPNLPEASVLPESLAWSRGRLYYDLNYNPDNSAITAARAAGLPTIDGSAMLTGQALRSLEIWTGETVAFDAVHEAVFGASANGEQA